MFGVKSITSSKQKAANMVLTMITNAVDSTLANITVPQACLAVVTVGLIISWASRQKKKLPPGPPPLPLLGNILELRGFNTYAKCLEWKEKYGPVLTFYIGRQPTVVISSIETLTEAYVQRAPDFASRPIMPSLEKLSGGGQNLAFATYNPRQRQTRKLEMQALRQYQTGTQLAERVHEVVKMTVANIKKEKGPFDPHPHLSHNVFNILHNICFGYARTIDDPVFHEMLDLLDGAISKITTFWEDSFPLLVHFPTKNYRSFLKASDGALEYVAEHVKKAEANFDENSIKTMLDSMLLAKKQAEQGEKDASKPKITSTRVKHMIFEIFLAGTDTSRNSLEWMLLLLAEKPEIQKKIQDEIDTKIGDGVPGRDHRLDLVYTEAFIMEALRIYPVAPMGLPHETLCDTQVGGFEVPAKTQVLVNQYAILHDPKHWENPEKFMPERYIEAGGEKLKPRPKSWIPFSIGQRNCPGEILAKRDIIYTMVGILQKLSFAMAPGTKADFTPQDNAFNMTCRRFKLVATPRN